MRDEFNNYNNINNDKVIKEEKVSEYLKVDEIPQVKDNKIPENDIEIKEVKKKSSSNNSKDQSNILSKLSGFFVSVVAAVTLVLPLTTEKNLDFQFVDIYVTDTMVQAGVAIDENSTYDGDLYFVFSNDFIRIEEEIVDNHCYRSFENLKPSMSYTLSVETNSTFGREVLGKMNVRTMSEEDYVITEFYSVFTECKCNVDGNFYFQMDFIDEFNIYSNPVAYLEDESGNRSYCEFNEDLHSLQEILVIDSKLDLASSISLKIYMDVSGDTQLMFDAIVDI